MINRLIELDKIVKEISFEELKMNIYEQKDVLLLDLFENYIRLKFISNMRIYEAITSSFVDWESEVKE